MENTISIRKTYFLSSWALYFNVNMQINNILLRVLCALRTIQKYWSMNDKRHSHLVKMLKEGLFEVLTTRVILVTSHMKIRTKTIKVKETTNLMP